MREGKKILNDNRVTEITEHTENSNGGEQQRWRTAGERRRLGDIPSIAENDQNFFVFDNGAPTQRCLPDSAFLRCSPP
jgi:hypothetical protein